MFALIAASVESSNPCCAVVAVDVMHVESGEVRTARVYLGVGDDEIAIDGVECPAFEARELEGFVRSVRHELEARLAESGEADT
jgi:phage protein U